MQGLSEESFVTDPDLRVLTSRLRGCRYIPNYLNQMLFKNSAPLRLCVRSIRKRLVASFGSGHRCRIAVSLVTALLSCTVASPSFAEKDQKTQKDQKEEKEHVSEYDKWQAERAKRAAKEVAKLPTAVTPPVRDPHHTFQLRVRDYVELKRRNIVMQQRDYSCGAACLATVCKYYWGDNVDELVFLKALDSILTHEEIADRIENGLAMSDLRKAAVDVGYQAVVGKLTFAKLMETKVPVIVGISPEGHDHFVVYRGTDGEWVYVADPIRGNLRMPICEFTKQWQENAVLVIAKPGKKVRKWSPLSVRPEEMALGELNDQLIRTQPNRQPAVPKAMLR